MQPLAWIGRQLKAASSRAAAADVLPHQRTFGRGQDWTPTVFGEYYATSPTVYAAIRVRADALTRAKLYVRRIAPDRTSQPVPPEHSAQVLLDAPNPHMTAKELIVAIEVFLCLYGRAHISIEFDKEAGRPYLWPLRPDRLLTLPGAGQRFIKGHVYRGAAHDITYTADEVVSWYLFNPMEDRSGQSPMAPLRLTTDTAQAALRYNRNTFRNGGMPDFMLFGNETMTQVEVEAFYERWDARFKGPDKAHRPAIATSLDHMESMAFSAREMEYIKGLEWGLEETSRVFGVPQPFLGSLREATLANVESLERIFWRVTLIPRAELIAAKLTRELLPRLDYARNLEVAFDYTAIEVLTEDEDARIKREETYLDRGVMTINEVRKARGWNPLPGGDELRREAPGEPDETQSTAHNGRHPVGRPAP